MRDAPLCQERFLWHLVPDEWGGDAQVAHASPPGQHYEDGQRS